MGLTDLSEMGLEDEVLELPIRGQVYAFKAVTARFGRAFRRAATSGRMDQELLPDDPTSDEYRHLFGDQYDTMLDLLSDPEWQHVTNVLATWLLAGRQAAERVWEKALPEPKAPAMRRSSAGARKTRTATTSGTSTAAATSRPRAKTARSSAGGKSSRTTT